MATATVSVDVGSPRLRPVARWVPTVDERGRRRLVMQWQVPDLDEALLAVLDEAR